MRVGKALLKADNGQLLSPIAILVMTPVPSQSPRAGVGEGTVTVTHAIGAKSASVTGALPRYFRF
jgi:hypothetical protein